MSAEMLSMKGIRKEFPGVLAVDGVDFSASRGEVMGLLGENGAGKSTLMGLLYGVYRLDSGKISIEGKEVSIRNSRDAIGLGLGMVHQSFTLVPNLTVAENIVLGAEPTKAGILDRATARKSVADLMKRSGLAIDPDLLVEDIPTGFKQRVEIMKALYRGAKVLILDEPTAVLTPLETEELFRSMRRLAEAGSTVIFITHKLKEVLAITNRITVMRHGKIVGVLGTPEASVHSLADMMVGRRVERNFTFVNREPGDVILDVSGLSVAGKYRAKAVEDCTFDVRGGEIVGVAGVEGNGQTELVEAITGLLKPTKGRVRIRGVETAKLSVKQIMDLSVGHVPEDRALSGLVLDFSLAENSILGKTGDPSYSRRGFTQVKKINSLARKIVSSFNVAASSISVKARNLSGGNQQKVIVGRELTGDPRLLIAHQPTRGLDVASTLYIQTLLVEARNSGRGVLLVSADFDEILDLSDRILVLYEGRIIGESKRGIDITALGKMLGGVTA